MSFWFLAGLTPGALVYAALFLWADNRRRWRGRKPISKEKLLRSPGESLREKISGLHEKALLPILLLSLTAAVSAVSIDRFMQLKGDIRYQISAVVWSLGTLIAVLSGWRLLCILRKLADYHLGLSGELAVGEELNRLMRHGCSVFHDMETDYGNIDHVVVAPTGVFAIETKARRKRSAKEGRDYEVTFTGERLEFPAWTETRPLKQAERNAGLLADFIEKAGREPVKVQPVVVLPGWWIHRQGKGRVQVINQKEIQSGILRFGRERLDSKQMD